MTTQNFERAVTIQEQLYELKSHMQEVDAAMKHAADEKGKRKIVLGISVSGLVQVDLESKLLPKTVHEILELYKKKGEKEIAQLEEEFSKL